MSGRPPLQPDQTGSGDDVQRVPHRIDTIDWWIVVTIVLWGLVRLMPNLDHPFIMGFDEAAHQATTRGTYDTFFFPHIFTQHLFEQPEGPWRHWMNAEAFLDKPAAPFWFGALVMPVIGVSPAALRFGSVLGSIAMALVIFLLGRRFAGRFWATFSAFAFLSLPFGYRLVQGYQFGDATDATVAGWVAITMFVLVWAVERDSWRWYVAAGVALGIAYLSKGSLGLMPLFVVGQLCAARHLKICRGPRLRDLGLLLGAAVLVAAPWTIYSAIKWPAAFAHAANIMHANFFGRMAPWDRPIDGLFNDALVSEMSPIPIVVVIIGAGWLLWRAVSTRNHQVIAVAAWLCTTWFILSLASAKQPSRPWGSIPAVFIGCAILYRDLWTRPVLAALVGGAMLSEWVMKIIPALGKLREFVPVTLEATRKTPGLVEGATVAVSLAVVVAIALKLLRNPVWLSRAISGCVIAGGLWVWGIKPIGAQTETAEKLRHGDGLQSHTRDVGIAIDMATPKRSVVFLSTDIETPTQLGTFDVQNLIFWSGRMTYRMAPDPQRAISRGLHPILVSPRAEPYLPIDNVPPHAALRAYDLTKPQGLPPIPKGTIPVNITVGPMTVLAVGVGPIDSLYDRYTFFVRTDGVPSGFPVKFHLAKGSKAIQVEPEVSLKNRQGLAGSHWFVMPTVGPPRKDVGEIEFGSGQRFKWP